MADSTAAAAVTIQSNIHNSDGNNSVTNYALFLGGTNVTHDVLTQYDPLKTGYARLFMIRKPTWVNRYLGDKFDKFKHILEYGNTSIQGLGDITVNMNQITGGYTGKSFEIPSVAQDDMNQFSVQVYEFSGSPIREVLHTWINGTTDILTGLTHYNGLVGADDDNGVPASQANQTAEFIYVVTDCTGMNPEYVCMFANCFPRGINLDPFNYTSGEHELVQTTIEFSCTKYESPQINAVGAALLKKYRILANSMNFHSGVYVTAPAGSTDKESVNTGDGTYYDVTNGEIVKGGSNGEWGTPSQVQLNTPQPETTWTTNKVSY
jgi:hypothetical protein